MQSHPFDFLRICERRPRHKFHLIVHFSGQTDRKAASGVARCMLHVALPRAVDRASSTYVEDVPLAGFNHVSIVECMEVLADARVQQTQRCVPFPTNPSAPPAVMRQCVPTVGRRTRVRAFAQRSQMHEAVLYISALLHSMFAMSCKPLDKKSDKSLHMRQSRSCSCHRFDRVSVAVGWFQMQRPQTRPHARVGGQRALAYAQPTARSAPAPRAA